MEARLGSARHVNPESSRVAARGRGAWRLPCDDVF